MRNGCLSIRQRDKVFLEETRNLHNLRSTIIFNHFQYTHDTTIFFGKYFLVCK